MSDVPGDALAAIDWLLDPLAADRRKEVYWRSVMLKAMIEIQQGRAEVERLRGSCQFDADGKPLAICHKLATAQAENERLRAALGLYGRHRAGCAATFYLTSNPPKQQPCDCGLDAALSPMKEVQR